MDNIEPELQTYCHAPIPTQNPYNNSNIVLKLLQRLEAGLRPRIAILDIDFTLTGDPPLAVSVRELLDTLGFVTIFATSRPAEMAMSQAEFFLSKKGGFHRPPPRMGVDKKTKKRVLAFADEVESEAGLYDPEVIAGTTGTEIFVHHIKGGFEQDYSYRSEMKEEASAWHVRARTIISRLCRIVNPTGDIIHYSLVDDKRNYTQGLVDVAPPDYEIHLDFEAQNSKKALHTKEAFKKAFEDFKYHSKYYRTDPNRLNICLTDDNTKNDSGKYSIFFTPNSGNKDHAVETILQALSQELCLDKDEFELLIVGDSYSDLRMGLWGGMDIRPHQPNFGSLVRFLLVGGSRLQSSFRMPQADENTHITRLLRNRITEVEPGIYLFNPPFADNRIIIVGDKKYPGTQGPQTILTFLKDTYRKELFRNSSGIDYTDQT